MRQAHALHFHHRSVTDQLPDALVTAPGTACGNLLQASRREPGAPPWRPRSSVGLSTGPPHPRHETSNVAVARCSLPGSWRSPPRRPPWLARVTIWLSGGKTRDKLGFVFCMWHKHRATCAQVPRLHRRSERIYRKGPSRKEEEEEAAAAAAEGTGDPFSGQVKNHKEGPSASGRSPSRDPHAHTCGKVSAVYGSG